MNISKSINYFFIAIGAIVALYAQNQEEQNQMLLIGGIVLLMIGIYRISRHIPDKKEPEDNPQNDQES
jgi:uncharacterized membrane protein